MHRLFLEMEYCPLYGALVGTLEQYRRHMQWYLGKMDPPASHALLMLLKEEDALLLRITKCDSALRRQFLTRGTHHAYEAELERAERRLAVVSSIILREHLHTRPTILIKAKSNE